MKFIKVCRLGTDQEVLLNLMHVEYARPVNDEGGFVVLTLQTVTGLGYWSRNSFVTEAEAERWFMSQLAESPREVPERVVSPRPKPVPEIQIGIPPD